MSKLKPFLHLNCVSERLKMFKWGNVWKLRLQHFLQTSYGYFPVKNVGKDQISFLLTYGLFSACSLGWKYILTNVILVSSQQGASSAAVKETPPVVSPYFMHHVRPPVCCRQMLPSKDYSEHLWSSCVKATIQTCITCHGKLYNYSIK